MSGVVEGDLVAVGEELVERDSVWQHGLVVVCDTEQSGDGHALRDNECACNNDRNSNEQECDTNFNQ